MSPNGPPVLLRQTAFGRPGVTLFRWLPSVGVLLACALASSTANAEALRVMQVNPGLMPEFEVQMNAGQSTTIDASATTPGVDPVLHLWDPVTNMELAMDDNSGGGRAARLEFQAPRTGTYLLVVRPRGFTAGEVALTRDGTAWQAGVKLRAGHQVLPNLRAREQVVTISPPRGTFEHIVYLLADDGMRIEKRLVGVPRTHWRVPQGHWGARTLLVATAADDASPVRMYRNDVAFSGADPDRDGLGVELERQLQTCSSATDSFGAFTCDRVVDLRDTDGDGISDGWEVLGRDFGNVYVALPTWGSDPRHKDIFIEVDYRRLTAEENSTGIDEKMPAAVALEFADMFADKATTDPLIRLHHATLVGNPDQQPGINIHLDTGRPPERPEHATIYGDWGGYDALDAKQAGDGNWVGQDIGNLWKTKMHASRRGIFRYGPGHKDGGGKCSSGIACGYNFNSIGNFAHETLHGLDIDHNGPWDIDRIPANCKPNWPSNANYAYYSQFRLSDGRGRGPLNNTRLREWKAVAVPRQCPHELEHNPEGLQLAAGPANASGVRCDNRSDPYMRDLSTLYRYRVDFDNGHVDWNRDGIFAPENQTVRAYANLQPSESCEFTRYNRVVFRNTEPVALAITRVGHHTLIFDLDQQGALRYRDSVSDWQCAPADEDCPGSSFGDPVAVSFGRAIRAFDAEAVNIDGSYQVAIVAVDDRGLMRERRLHLKPDGTLSLDQGIRTLRTSQPVAGDPSLSATRDGTTLFLAYKHFDNGLFWNSRKTQFWEAERRASDGPGRPLATTPDASAALAGGYALGTSDEVMYLFHLNAEGKLRLRTFDPEQERWPDVRKADREGTYSIRGRPALEWVPNALGSETPGQLHMGYRTLEGHYRMMRSHYDTGQERLVFGLESSFDNVWLTGNAFDWTASGAGTHPQLWAVLHFKNEDLGSHIQFRPRADGILDVDMRNYDDWSVVAWAACRHIVNPGDLVSSPIRCGPRPW